MADLIIDTHLHIYETKRQGQAWKDSFEIAEYGPKRDVAMSARAGDLSDALAQMQDGHVWRAVVLNLFSTLAGERETIVERSPGSSSGKPMRRTIASARRRLVEYNSWTCKMAQEHDQLIPFISVDPWVMTADEMGRHIEQMAATQGARGVKLHPISQRFAADDRRLWSVYRTCESLSIPIVAHSGSSSSNSYAEPTTFAPVLTAFPNLKMVLAHLGGGAWSQTRALASQFPQVHFDCSEIIAWTGAPGAPTQRELATLIRDVGAHRVLMGTDFPWYDAAKTIEQIWSLPILGAEEKYSIIGVNAARLMGLPETATVD